MNTRKYKYKVRQTKKRKKGGMRSTSRRSSKSRSRNKSLSRTVSSEIKKIPIGTHITFNVENSTVNIGNESLKLNGCNLSEMVDFPETGDEVYICRSTQTLHFTVLYTKQGLSDIYSFGFEKKPGDAPSKGDNEKKIFTNNALGIYSPDRLAVKNNEVICIDTFTMTDKDSEKFRSELNMDEDRIHHGMIKGRIPYQFRQIQQDGQIMTYAKIMTGWRRNYVGNCVSMILKVFPYRSKWIVGIMARLFHGG